MSCSKDGVMKDMLHKNLVDRNMKIPTVFPSAKLLDYIDRITNLARDKYGVDMGMLINVKHRNTSSPLKTSSEYVLEMNSPAFEAIDQSEVMEEMKEIERLEKQKYSLLKEMHNISTEGNYEIVDGEVMVPDSFNYGSMPLINVKC